ncbi:MAG TPA: C4-type zinc ribbon domain-containing protein [Actinomycetota bacterium]|nr:C4-type zinc ribbon domain-containing protein [Actinomycetota bacterium]
MGTEETTAQSLKPLLDLQQVDLTRDRLNERKAQLPERIELADREQRVAEIQAAIQRLDDQIAKVVKEMDRLEAEASAIVAKITSEEQRMYSGQVVNPKELSGITAEVEMLRRRKAPLEDGAVEQMILRDELYAERDRLRAEIADLEAEADVLRGKIADQSGHIDQELAVEDARREGILPAIPDDILELYEDLRENKRGIGAGALEAGVCTACRETLSAMERDRIKRAARAGDLIFRCEHCRRILVVN